MHHGTTSGYWSSLDAPRMRCSTTTTDCCLSDLPRHFSLHWSRRFAAPVIRILVFQAAASKCCVYFRLTVTKQDNLVIFVFIIIYIIFCILMIGAYYSSSPRVRPCRNNGRQMLLWLKICGTWCDEGCILTSLPYSIMMTKTMGQDGGQFIKKFHLDLLICPFV